MTSDAPQAEISPNRQLFLENCTTGGTSSEKEEPTLGRTPELASRADKAEAESKTVEKTPNRSHDPREDLRSRGETKAKSRELVNFAERYEPKKLSGLRMHRKLQIHLLQDDVS